MSTIVVAEPSLRLSTACQFCSTLCVRTLVTVDRALVILDTPRSRYGITVDEAGVGKRWPPQKKCRETQAALSAAAQAVVSAAAEHLQDAVNAMQQEIAGLRGRVEPCQTATRQTAQASLIYTHISENPILWTYELVGRTGASSSEAVCSPSVERLVERAQQACSVQPYYM